ncbi:creatininase family protein [candidate division KSB1 bacterium]
MKNTDNKKSETKSAARYPVCFRCDLLIILIIFIISFTVEIYIDNRQGIEETGKASMLNASLSIDYPGPDNVNSARTVVQQKQAESGGYSIFKGTMADMTWQEIEAAAKENTPVLMSIAVIEEHGPHMCNGIDTYLGYLACKLIKEELQSREKNVLIAPPFYWGINSANHMFPGTFTVREETMKALLHDIFVSLQSWGFNDVFLFIAHGDRLHNQVIFRSVIDSRRKLDINARIFYPESDMRRSGFSGRESFLAPYKFPVERPVTEYLDIHAGMFETGVVAAYFPELVNEEIARKLIGTRIRPQDAGEFYRNAKKVTPLGYIGDPAKYDADFAKEIWDALCKNLADAVEKEIK